MPIQVVYVGAKDPNSSPQGTTFLVHSSEFFKRFFKITYVCEWVCVRVSVGAP